MIHYPHDFNDVRDVHISRYTPGVVLVCRLSLGVLVSTTKPLNDWPCNNKEARRQDQPEESATKQQNDEEGLEPDIIEYNVWL